MSVDVQNKPPKVEEALLPGDKHISIERQRIREHRTKREPTPTFDLSRIKHKFVVLSGKGGVGKSTVAVNLAAGLSNKGKRVGLLDVDVHGPSIPTMLGLEGQTLQESHDMIKPVEVNGLKVMSVGFLLQSQNDAIIWRGPLKSGLIDQFIHQVYWGDLDFLIIDSPPGTGDELISVCQNVDKLDGAIVVTTPQRLAEVDVRKSISFCRKMKVNVTGIIENMSGFVCPECGKHIPILLSGGGKRIAESMKIPFLGAIPIDPKIAEACDNGLSFLTYYSESDSARIMNNIIKPIVELESTIEVETNHFRLTKKKDNTMRIAIPIENNLLAQHFGHCNSFALLDVDVASKTVLNRSDIDAPPHQPGLLPPWLAKREVDLVLAGGMGQRAIELFGNQGIKVLVGVDTRSPEELAEDYLQGKLEVNDNACDH
ncbi:P-loop NTPase [bacterium]|nr:P-loop NTPase [bacterium]